jgi:hypothetical protein
MQSRLSSWLSRQPQSVFSIFVIVAAFSTYFAMYAFRKPFASGTYSGLSLWGMDYKILLVIVQIFGYTLSKFLGIKIISEMKAGSRIKAILLLIGIAWLALLLFAIVPYPYNFICLFLNGLPLGMIWGIVFSFLEGRRNTELLGAGLCVSFIIASGVMKTMGLWWSMKFETWGMTAQQAEFWMPFASGAVFVPMLLAAVWLLSQVPPPTAEDIASRTKRVPMDGEARRNFVRQFAWGLGFLVAFYILLSIYRSIRDDFQAELWDALGYGGKPEIFTLSELPVALVSLLCVGLLFLIKNNRTAFRTNFLVVAIGCLLTLLATVGFEAGVVGGAWWIILVGMGLYMPYILFNAVIFDRMIAVFKTAANVGFLIYLADSFGYLGYVGVQLFRNFGLAELSWLTFFTNLSYIMGIGGLVLITLAFVYFERKASKFIPKQ